MTRRPLAPLLFLLLALVTATGRPAGGQAPALRGFPDDAAAEQRALEEKFRAVPSPERLREYLQAMSAEPHVAGRPGSRKVADYALDWAVEHARTPNAVSGGTTQ